MGPSIRLFSRSRTIERAYSFNRYTQCKNCWGYGHVAPRCPSADPVCPISSLNHTRAMNWCPNPTCPGGGNLKAAPSCCSSSPPRCVNRSGDHTASNSDCETRRSPPPLRRSTAANEVAPPPPAGDEMDTAADDRDGPPPPFTHTLPPVGVRDGYSKGQKDNDTSSLCKARTRLRTAPSLGASKPLSYKQNSLGPGPLMQYDESSWGGKQALPPPSETLHTRSTQLPRELGCVSFSVRVVYTAGPPSVQCSPARRSGLQGQASLVSFIH